LGEFNDSITFRAPNCTRIANVAGQEYSFHIIGVTHHLSALAQIGHLFVVAGYPTLGKSSSLWQAAQTGLPLFGKENGSVVPSMQALAGVGENSDTATKLQAGFWLTLADIPNLNNEPRLPKLLILHLDLLLAFLLLRDRQDPRVGPNAVAAAFARLFEQPALRHYQKCTVTTLFSRLDEVQRRWRHRYPGGIPFDSGKILRTKDQMINDPNVAAPLFVSIHRAWASCLKSLADRDMLAGHIQLGSTIRPGAGSAG